MTVPQPYPPGPYDPPPSTDAPAVEAPPAREPWVSRRELRAALVLVGVLAVVGVLAGLVWLWWSPARGIALAVGAHSLIPDETENFIAADGRFAVLTAGIGLAAGITAWCWRSVRGPALAVGLAVGSMLGAVFTSLIGRWLGGGVTGAATQKIVTPPLELRAVGLLTLQAAVALLVYGLLVTVAARDDLGVAARNPDRDDDDLRRTASVFDAPPPVEPPRA